MTTLLLLLLPACGGQTGSLVGHGEGSCETTASGLDADEVSDLGFSANDVRALFGEPATFTITYDDDTLGHATDTVTLADAGDFEAARISRSGEGCGPDGEPEVVRAAWSVAATTASGDATGDGVVIAEATAADAASVRLAGSGGDATFAAGVWDLFYAEFPNRADDACVSGLHWSGPVTAARWGLTVDCDENADGSPEFSGTWKDGEMALVP